MFGRNRKEIKMIACDLDGTLLYDPSKVTERTKKAIQAVRRQGIMFGVCSGRSAIAVQKKLKDWGIDEDVDFILGFNGGMLIEHGQESQWLELPAREIPVIMNAFKGYSVAFAEYAGHEMLATRSNPITRRMASRNKLTFKKVKPEQLYRPTLKLMAIGMPWVINRWFDSGKKVAGCRMFRSGPFLIEIVHHRLSKLYGVKEVADAYGISLDEVMTFGNDNNDLEMLEGTVGVAMGNALPEVKKVAAFVTGSNRKDGVAAFLEEHVLLDHAEENENQQ